MMTKEIREANALQDVREFHETFNLPVLERPTIPAEDRIRLRINLLREELKELEEALNQGDLVETADALADIQYVLSGAIHEFGMGDCFKAVFDEVHRSNMSKVCPTMEVAERTAAHYREQGHDAKIVPKGEGYIVYRLSDGKVLKSVEYSAADIAKALRGGVI